MLRMAHLGTNSKGILDSSHRLGRVFLTAAAALSTSLPARVDAFSVVRPYHHLPRPIKNGDFDRYSPSQNNLLVLRHSRQTRLYSSPKKDDGILKKVAKTLLPKKWFQSEEEKKAELVRQQARDNVKGGIKEMLKGAPLPVRMMGSMVAPLLSRVASDLSESVAEQQRTIESVLEDSRGYILGDDVACQALGEPIRVGSPFSQSSSTSIINGQKTVNIILGFPVEGSRSSGVAQAQANENGISQLLLQVDGRQIHVSLAKRKNAIGKNHRSTNKSYFAGDDDDNIIEAEIIEKDTKK
ncbi:expressed unknown protein [Seminavis robusta]|uniref:Uncharacterized protein n=1 Tax=Seminavis robusta TaxID=568900 RepID=A0A9N8H394_9STRA|nr:expressed unknown protein [Seminavis robusta]|eukprot:Sro22_g015200.1 n/a (297) ;mRNA; r:35569-36459